jgi:hypothetical protein
MIRLIGRLKSLLHKQSLPSETEEIQRAQAGFVCVDAVSTARSSTIALFPCGIKILSLLPSTGKNIFNRVSNALDIFL